MLNLNNGNACEPCGWERYYYIEYPKEETRRFYHQKYRQQHIDDSEMIIPRFRKGRFANTGFGVYDIAEYQGKLYYYDETYTQKNNYYLFSCDINGSNENVVMPFKKRNGDLMITINRFGIFFIYLTERKIRVVVYNLKGKELCDIPIDMNRSSWHSDFIPYVCDNKIFQIVKEKTIYKALVIDLDIQNVSYTSKVIYEGMNLNDKRKGVDAAYYPVCIIGSSDYALLCVNYNFQHNDFSKNIKTDTFTKAWYYVSLNDGKMYCLSNPHFSPESLKTMPEKYIEYLETPQAEKDWFKIAYFDIGKNLIWIYRNLRNKQTNTIVNCIVPYNLSIDFYDHRRNDYQIWQSGEYHGEKCYFDGKHRFASRSYSGFYSYDKQGKISKWSGSHGACDRFSVKMNTLFLDSDLSGDDSQFDLNDYYYHEPNHYNEQGFYVPKKLRCNWIRGNTQAREKRNELVKEYEASKKAKSLTLTAPSNAAVPVNKPSLHQKSILPSAPMKAPTNYIQNTGITFVPDNKLEYWQGFGDYLSGKIPAIVRIPKAADRNWYALRLGSSKYRIECSVSVKNQTLRVGFFMENSDSVYGKAAQHKKEIDSILKKCCSAVSEIRWDNSVADANVSIVIPMNCLDKSAQYEIMKDIIFGMTNIIGYIDN